MIQHSYIAQPGGGFLKVIEESAGGEFADRVEACAAENPGVVVLGVQHFAAGELKLEEIRPMPEIGPAPPLPLK